jgi:hypothetical protein
VDYLLVSSFFQGVTRPCRPSSTVQPSASAGRPRYVEKDAATAVRPPVDWAIRPVETLTSSIGEKQRHAINRTEGVAMTTTEHREAERHHHTHGPGCGHASVLHGDHVDYLHDGHVHREHRTSDGVHYDECTTCQCANCSDSCAICICADCTCPTCNHNNCQCADCADACNNCTCADCTCPTCTHAG